jgi:hypothetical protein
VKEAVGPVKPLLGMKVKVPSVFIETVPSGELTTVGNNVSAFGSESLTKTDEPK